ncbi:MAG: hypothetical protein J6V99_09225 [Neisseriaceae bacterium]|nr:hypothetical protein [Neisseriaceae bacterium]
MKNKLLALCVVGLMIASNSVSAESYEPIACYEQLDITSNCPADIKTNKNRKKLCTGKWVKARVDVETAIKSIHAFNTEASNAKNRGLPFSEIEKINDKYPTYICFDRRNEGWWHRDSFLVSNNRSTDKLFAYYLDTNKPLEPIDFEIFYTLTQSVEESRDGKRTTYTPTRKDARDFLAKSTADRPKLSYRQAIEIAEPLYKKLSKENKEKAIEERARICGVGSGVYECSINQHKQITNKYRNKKGKK